MKSHNLICIEQVCTHYKVEAAFIRALQELGHIKVIAEDNDQYITNDQLRSLESMIFFYNELQINIEGIDAIAHLLEQIQDLKDELRVANSKLSFLGGD